MGRPSSYPRELRERAVRLVAESKGEYPTEFAAITSVAQKLGIGSAETLRKWVRRAQVDAGERPGLTSEEHAEIKRLKRENAELRRANEILKCASAFFAAELPTPVLVDYIVEHRDEFGVEPICRVLSEHGCPIAPSTFYDTTSQRPHSPTA